MLGRLAAVAALAALMASCAGFESAGRNAARGPQAAPPPSAASSPAPSYAAPPPEPASSAPTTGAAAAPAPSDAGNDPPTQNVDTRASGNDVVVPGIRERQVPAPGGDPRSTAERMADIAAWDRCVMRVQSAFESDPMRPQLESPEEYCRQSLGMANRDAIPMSRIEGRR